MCALEPWNAVFSSLNALFGSMFHSCSPQFSALLSLQWGRGELFPPLALRALFITAMKDFRNCSSTTSGYSWTAVFYARYNILQISAILDDRHWFNTSQRNGGPRCSMLANLQFVALASHWCLHFWLYGWRPVGLMSWSGPLHCPARQTSIF